MHINEIEIINHIFYVDMVNNLSHPSLIELTQIIFDIELTYFGSETSNCKYKNCCNPRKGKHLNMRDRITYYTIMILHTTLLLKLSA